MSAFMCSDLHLSILARYAHEFLPEATQWRDASEIGELLQSANEASLAYRYPGDTRNTFEFQLSPAEDVYDYDAQRRMHVWNHVKVYKLAQCYRYQACEPDTWKGSTAETIALAIEREALAQEWRRQVEASPAYDKAPWGVP